MAAIAFERGALNGAEFVEVESSRNNGRPQWTAGLAQALGEKAVIAVAMIDCLAHEAGFVLRLANEAEKNGMGGFVFCDLPDLQTTTSPGRMVLTMMASVDEFEARRIIMRSQEALAACKVRGVRFVGYWQFAAEEASVRKQKSIAEAGAFRGVLDPRVCADLSDGAMAALAGVGKLSTTGRPLAPAQMGRILQF